MTKEQREKERIIEVFNRTGDLVPIARHVANHLAGCPDGAGMKDLETVGGGMSPTTIRYILGALIAIGAVGRHDVVVAKRGCPRLIYRWLGMPQWHGPPHRPVLGCEMGRPIEVADSEFVIVDARVSELAPSADNPRITLRNIPALAESIAANGLRKPLAVMLDGTIVDGHRRLAAMRLLGWHLTDKMVPVRLYANSRAALLDRLEQHGHGPATETAHSAYEQAEALNQALNALTLDEVLSLTREDKKLAERRLSAYRLLQRFGHGPQKMAIFQQALRIGVSPDVVDKLIRSGHLSSYRQVCLVPAVLRYFRKPWESKKTLERMNQLAGQYEGEGKKGYTPNTIGPTLAME